MGLVERFLNREGLEHVTVGPCRCCICGDTFDASGDCTGEDCESTRDEASGESFSWSSCEICGNTEGGNRHVVTGVETLGGEMYQYDVCDDCVYTIAYGEG